MITGGSLGFLHNLTFAIDTAATRTTIDAQVARELGLMGRPRDVSVAGKKVRVEEVAIPQLCLSETCFAPTVGWSADLSPFRLKLDGLIGLDLLRQANLTIDFLERKLWFGPVSHSQSVQHFYGLLPYVPIRIDVADETLCMILDSAGEEILLFEKQIRASMSYERTGKKAWLNGSGLKTLVEQVVLDELSFGERRWRRRVAYLIKENQFENVEGIIGLSALELRRLNLDFENSLLSWE